MIDESDKKFWHSSDMCVCGHHMHYHYRKNYLSHPLGRSEEWGNINFRGCDLCNIIDEECSHLDDNGQVSRRFKHIKVPSDFHDFENDFRWDIRDKEFRKLYDDEVRGHGKIPLMRAYDWIIENQERYVKMLKEAGVEFNDGV